MIHINAAGRFAGQQWRMMGGLQWICSFDTTLRGGLLVGLFVAGLTGSAVHCGPMCGVFVLGQVSERMARLPAVRLCEAQRVSQGLLLPYHLGRLTSYAGLGALAAGSAAVFGQVLWFRQLSVVLLVVAALLFLAQALKRVVPGGGWLDRVPRGWSRLIAAFTSRIVRGSAGGEYLLGLALGFLPCGFLYAAIAAAAASARPLVGAAAMVAFGLGTAPALMVVGTAGYAAARRWIGGVQAAAPLVMGLNAMLLLAMAWQR